VSKSWLRAPYAAIGVGGKGEQIFLEKGRGRVDRAARWEAKSGKDGSFPL